MKIVSILKKYLMLSGILLNSGLLLAGLYTVGWAVKKQVTIDDVLVKSAEMLKEDAPALANFMVSSANVPIIFDAFSDVDLNELNGVGATSTNIGYVPPSAVQEGEDNVAEVHVSNSKGLLKAIKNATPGENIILEPGVYRIKAKRIPINIAGERASPIHVKALQLGDAKIELDAVEGFHVLKPFWVFENLVIRGVCVRHSSCEHAFHVVGEANNTVIRNNIISDFNAAIKINSTGKKNKKVFPDYGVIENNTIVNNSPRDTGNSVTLIDAVAVSDWVVRGNIIADFIKLHGNQVSYGAFFKGAGERNIFEQNFIVCQLKQKIDQGALVGVSFGGGGTGRSMCRDADCIVEHKAGIIRNNVIMNCNDVGVYLNKAKGSEIYNNTILNTLGVDVRFPESSAVIANNVITGRIKERDGADSQSFSNYVVGMDKLSDIYENPYTAKFDLKDASVLVDKGIDLQNAEKDFCGNTRGPTRVDIGAIEYGNGRNVCNPVNMR